MCAVLLQRYHKSERTNRHYDNRINENVDDEDQDENDNSDREQDTVDHHYILKPQYSRIFKPKSWFQNRFRNSNWSTETNEGLRFRSNNLKQYPMLLSNTKLPPNAISRNSRITTANFLKSSASKRKETIGQILINCKTRAMRYYRVWIYACNIILFVSVFSFCLIGCRVLIFDFRRSLVPNLSLLQPSFLYAYLALFTQCGLIQLVGCLGALRLNERLINAYWMMLMLLLFGDIVIGLFWIFNYGKICQELKPSLRLKLNTLYGYDRYTTNLWDRFQSEYHCCGVDNVYDYKSLPILNVQDDETNLLETVLYSTIQVVDNLRDFKDDIPSDLLKNGIFLIPKSCCLSVIEKELVMLNENSSASLLPNSSAAVHQFSEKKSNSTSSSLDAHLDYQPVQNEKVCQSVHSADCTERMFEYIENTANILFIFGYCVVAFLKLCFLGILRYEIQEMIQKMRVLRLEILTNNISMNEGMKSSSNQAQNHILSQITSHNIDHGDVIVKSKYSRKYDSTESERENLLNDYHRRNSLTKELSFSNEHLNRSGATKTVSSNIEPQPQPQQQPSLVLPSTSHAAGQQQCSFVIEPSSDPVPISRRSSMSSYELSEFQNNHNNNTLAPLNEFNMMSSNPAVYKRKYRMSSPDTTFSQNM